MVSLKMFQIPHSEALIIAYLDLRSGPKFQRYLFNATDVSNQTNIGKTVVRQNLKELVAEGVLKRKGKSFYQLNRQQMEQTYYRHVSESDTDLSEVDTDVSESDTEVSESDSIHSSNLHSRKLDSSKLHCSTISGSSGFPVTLAPETSATKTPPACEPKREADSVGQPAATKSGDARSPAPEKYSAEYWRQMVAEQNRNRRLYGSPFGRR
jgi:hypothetical protein